MASECRGTPGFAKLIVRSVFLVFIAVSMFAVTAAAEDPPAFLLKWGSSGSGDGQFQGPFGIAVDSWGHVYVSDSTNRIQKFDSNGNFLTKWGAPGTGNGEFTFPMGIAVDATGNVYVTDQGNRRIQKFDGNGNFLTTWGSQGSGNGQFEGPQYIAVDSAGNVYVSDSGNARVQKFNSNGTFLAKWGTYGTGNGEFTSPMGIAVDSSGNVYVADMGNSNGRVQKFDGNGNFLFKLGYCNDGETPPGDGNICHPAGLAVDSLGNVYVSETEWAWPPFPHYGHWIQKFDGNGTFLTRWGRYGTSDGQFINPYGLAVDFSGHVFVADTYRNRIQKFGPSPPGETPTGFNVSATPVDPNPVVSGTSVKVTFADVLEAGITTLTTTQIGTPPPTGFSLGDPPVYFDIRTTATVAPSITVCIHYTGISFGDESKLRLYHQTPGGVWEDVTTSLDTVNDIICGVSSSLSPFAILKATYQFVGFFPPVQTGAAVVNLAKAGSAIPLKWQLRDKSGRFINDLKAVTGIRYQERKCSDSTLLNDLVQADSSGSSGLKVSGNQYHYNWKTSKNMAGKCYRLDVELFHFDVHSADFQMW